MEFILKLPNWSLKHVNVVVIYFIFISLIEIWCQKCLKIIKDVNNFILAARVRVYRLLPILHGSPRLRNSKPDGAGGSSLNSHSMAIWYKLKRFGDSDQQGWTAVVSCFTYSLQIFKFANLQCTISIHI